MANPLFEGEKPKKVRFKPKEWHLYQEEIGLSVR